MLVDQDIMSYLEKQITFQDSLYQLKVGNLQSEEQVHTFMKNFCLQMVLMSRYIQLVRTMLMLKQENAQLLMELSKETIMGRK